MTIDLKYYLNKKVENQLIKPKKVKPFVTISRETGCNSMIVAKLLQNIIQSHTSQKWKLLTKELIEENAKALELDLTQVRGIFESEKRTHIEEVLRAFGNRYYKSDRSIRNTLKNIIGEIAQDGNVIIVGRAGAVITSGFDKGLHFRLTAPFEWRVKKLQIEKNFTANEAIEYVKESDQKRNNLFFDFSGKYISEISFDMVLNNARLSDAEIAKIIFDLLKMRQML